MTNPDGLLRENAHDRDISEIRATITAVDRPSFSLLRVTAHLPGAAQNPVWGIPNVAVRFYLDDATRVYTVRSFDRACESMVVDVVQHGHPSPMMSWSETVAPGDELTLTGPRPHFPLPPGGKVALFLDDTAIPALAAIMDQWPAGVGGVGWVVTEDVAAFEELPHIEGLELHLLAPGDQPLADKARELPNPSTHVVWAAGERDEMKSIRGYFRRDIGLEKESVAVFGYWKKGTTNTRIDQVRRDHYMRLLAEGGDLEGFDDLSLEI
ncbi:siderophore-interacting protein [Corynebacterium pacaense]|uniref:siderophore-interacting protein n=1 Tax=Corynebacterium pacaense TaxID=1816684 RepID=UPI0009BAC1B6|nr:SIP domain-containing protein [Corynebacterium pacaense]